MFDLKFNVTFLLQLSNTGRLSLGDIQAPDERLLESRPEPPTQVHRPRAHVQTVHGRIQVANFIFHSFLQ